MINLSPIQSIISAFAHVVGSLVPVLVTLGLAVFLWGLVRYMWDKRGDSKALADSKKIMGWGLIILFVMVSVWGIIALMQEALGINPNAPGRAPQIQYGGSSGGSFNTTGSLY